MWYLIVLSIACISTVVAHRMFKSEYHWLEVLGQLVIPLSLSLGILGLGNLFRGMDTEYWGDRLETIWYEGRYEDYEWNPCCHEYKCNCTTDKDGRESCDTCCDGCWECNSYGPYYYKEGKSSKRYNIRSKEYQRTLKSLGHDSDTKDVAATNRRHRKLNHVGSCNRDDGIYRADWTGTIETVENIASEHTYTNKIRFSNTAYAFESVSDDLVKELGLVNYSDPRQYYQLDIMGPMATKLSNYPTAIRKLAFFNGEYGSALQIKFLIFVIPHSESGLYWQKQLLENGNKNEFCLLLSVDGSGKIVDYDAISWTLRTECMSLTEDFLYSYTGNDLVEIVDTTTQILQANWKRREFTELNETVNLQPPVWAGILAIILQIGLSIGLAYLFTQNYFGENNSLRDL